MASSNNKHMLLRAVLAVTATILATAHARVHHLFVGNLYPPPRLYALVFDDETLALEVTANMTADSSHAWIAFDAGKTNVYGSSLDKPAIASYEVVVNNSSSNTGNDGDDNYADDDEGAATTVTNVTLEFRKSVAAAGACANKTAAFVLPHPLFPRVYTASWPGPDACAMALSTNPDPTAPTNGSGGGMLEAVIQTWRYDSRTNSSGGIHGLALDPEGTALYSADLEGDAVWAHIVSPDGTGRVVGLRGRYDLPEGRKGSHPRHLVVHPNGRVLYVVMEAANVVAAYALDEVTRVPVAEISWHSLVPVGAEPGEYWAAEVMLSASPSTAGEGGGSGAGGPKYLWATARAWTGNGTIEPHTGFISVFALDGVTGEILGEQRQPLFRVPTTTLDGGANAISPAPWSEDWAAMTDIGTGYVQMWHIEKTTDENGEVTSTTARDVARVDIPDGGVVLMLSGMTEVTWVGKTCHLYHIWE
ncbi:3-carboxy-cis-cis-mucoante lactonizing enzyme [Apiospora hydei]|uniref:3-carboxy-cis-cis-mucoante lactonizing enzyme n=1 Tax=Apiospora hydei TaxID=1337664 RepID=A0ABR1UT99_9PEZI